MKTSFNKTVIIALLSVLMLSAGAIANNPGKMRESGLKNLLSRHIDYPANYVNPVPGRVSVVSVEIEITSSGEIVVTDINGEPVLAKYVEEKIEAIRFKPLKALAGTKHVFRFKFA